MGTDVKECINSHGPNAVITKQERHLLTLNCHRYRIIRFTVGNRNRINQIDGSPQDLKERLTVFFRQLHVAYLWGEPLQGRIDILFEERIGILLNQPGAEQCQNLLKRHALDEREFLRNSSLPVQLRKGFIPYARGEHCRINRERHPCALRHTVGIQFNLLIEKIPFAWCHVSHLRHPCDIQGSSSASCGRGGDINAFFVHIPGGVCAWGNMNTSLWCAAINRKFALHLIQRISIRIVDNGT